MIQPSRIALLLILCLGCSKGENRTASANVSGEVSYKGNLVKGGSVTFHTQTGAAVYSRSIDPDGTYSITDVPPGELVVTIETESVAVKGKVEKDYGDGKFKSSPRPDYAKGKTPAAFEYTKIPEKYSSKNKSPLTVTLTPGRNLKNFELTD